jgi:hypothetical protein
MMRWQGKSEGGRRKVTHRRTCKSSWKNQRWKTIEKMRSRPHTSRHRSSTSPRELGRSSCSWWWRRTSTGEVVRQGRRRIGPVSLQHLTRHGHSKQRHSWFSNKTPASSFESQLKQSRSDHGEKRMWRRRVTGQGNM